MVTSRVNRCVQFSALFEARPPAGGGVHQIWKSRAGHCLHVFVGIGFCENSRVDELHVEFGLSPGFWAKSLAWRNVLTSLGG